MTNPTQKNPRAGGVLIAITTIAGSVIGALLRQPSLGLLIGLAIGILIALALYLIDRNR